MIDQYKQAFQEEAREILLELETALLELNKRPADKELVGRAFRALHTIKGSGSMFGFEEIAAFTHHIENAFDQVRNGRLGATTELITLSLAAVDQIKTMLDESAGKGSADAVKSAEILGKLHDLIGQGEPRPAQQAPAQAAPSSPPTAGAVREWHLYFRPKPYLLSNGANPLLLLRELRQLGSMWIKADTSRIPELGELDPHSCYVSWDIILTTTALLDQIRDVFIFVEDSSELTIAESKSAPEAGMPALLPPLAERRIHGGRRAADREAQVPSLRVPAAKLDQLIDLVGELVTVQARLGQITTRFEDQDMQEVSEEIERLTASLRDTSMGMRTLPLRSTFERFRRLIFDLGRTLQKEVEFTFDGAETELDKTVIDQLNDPLMHLIRNSMDHGIEAPGERQALGKRAAGSIHLSARHVGAQVQISVADDGKGIDQEVVRARAIEKGLIAPETHLAESEIFSLIMAPGFSTAKQVTDVSGRGVGLDVVRRNVEALRGSIEIDSKFRAGSKITLRLPLTLAIIDGLLVRVGQTRFVLPLSNTVECIELTRQDVRNANGKCLANVRGEIIPYVRLSEYLHIPTEPLDREQLMVAETEQGRFGFVVEEVLGDHQTVIKNLGRMYRNVKTVSGATILGDGSVALILDLHRLAQDVVHAAAKKERIHASASRQEVMA
jgi:two-component system, chemotaxis family, sensor kinase CheA